jgi:hypothetical protein
MVRGVFGGIVGLKPFVAAYIAYRAYIHANESKILDQREQIALCVKGEERSGVEGTY